jgi:hypothetical protein
LALLFGSTRILSLHVTCRSFVTEQAEQVNTVNLERTTKLQKDEKVPQSRNSR